MARRRGDGDGDRLDEILSALGKLSGELAEFREWMDERFDTLEAKVAKPKKKTTRSTGGGESDKFWDEIEAARNDTRPLLSQEEVEKKFNIKTGRRRKSRR